MHRLLERSIQRTPGINRGRIVPCGAACGKYSQKACPGICQAPLSIAIHPTMHIATDPHSLPLAPRALARGCEVTIGNFDGVHKGHQSLIRHTISIARAKGLPAVVITFDPHPLRVILGAKAPAQLMSLQHKLECLAELGTDLVLVMPFIPELAARTPEDFVREVLVESLNTRGVVIGYDYAFGRARRGNAALLTSLGREYGFHVKEFPPVLVNGVIVSSTSIRNALSQGDVVRAADLLGRPHSVEGIIEHGMGRGGKVLGIPTANLRLDEPLLLPRQGVYAVLAEVAPKPHTLPGPYSGESGAFLRGVANVGKNPTFGDERLRVETHLLDFSGDIYGTRFRAHFIQRLREERKFAGVEELAKQIRRDVDAAKRALSIYFVRR